MQMPEQQPDPMAQLELMKFKDESARAWERLKIDAALAESRMSKEEIESIVALSTTKQKEVKDAVDAIQREAEIKLKGTNNANSGARRNGLEEPSDN